MSFSLARQGTRRESFKANEASCFNLCVPPNGLDNLFCGANRYNDNTALSDYVRGQKRHTNCECFVYLTKLEIGEGRGAGLAQRKRFAANGRRTACLITKCAGRF